jgi:transposase
MASIQAKTVNGRKYWQIVQSQRINGKPRPVVLEHLGTADTLLKKLQERRRSISVKSYSHGLVAVLLKLSSELNIVSAINNHVKSQRDYFAEHPIRNNLTVGATILLAAIGRISHPTSKRGWFSWAKRTSLQYLLRMNFSKVDSQHFWDMMDSLPAESIENIEQEILQTVKDQYKINTNTILYDTTNFYTYIATTNTRCKLPQRGKNKQKRVDLRQIGLAMVVSKEDMIPLFHETYRGNMNDSPVFKNVIGKIKNRMQSLGLNTTKHTAVFDRGCNSKKNLKQLTDLKMHYIGALSPAHHTQLIKDADENYTDVDVDGEALQVYRTKQEIWGEERTALVFISRQLKAGQLRGIYTGIEKRKEALDVLNTQLSNPKSKKRSRKELLENIGNILNKQSNLFDYELRKERNGPYCITYQLNNAVLDDMEDSMGFRIIMTSRHDWSTLDIIKGYYGQSFVEQSFKDVKNPFHLAVTPGFHWTDQKIRIHFFTCVLGFLLATLIRKQAKEKASYKGTLDNLLDQLSEVRLATLIETNKKKGKPKVTYQLEVTDGCEDEIMSALNIDRIHEKPMKIEGLSLYK